MESILISIKKLLGNTEDYDNFDTDIIIHINTAFTTLNQLGVGPSDGFSIADSEAKWSDYINPEDKNFNSVKTYIYLKVKMLFDPPLNSTVIDAIQQQIRELEWRLNVESESKK